MSQPVSEIAAAQPSQVIASCLAKKPDLWARIFFVLHGVALSAIALFTQPTLPLDVIEQLAWARDAQLVYFKHPPLPAWILAGVEGLTNHATWSAALVGPAASTLALWLVWRLAKRIVDPLSALIAVVVLEGVIYFNFTALEFNHDVVQLPLWGLIALLGHRVYRGAGLVDWAALGAAACLAMLGKYSSFLILISLAVPFVSHPYGRRHFATAGPWLAMLVGLLGLAPHLVALRAIDFAPFYFPFERAGIAGTPLDRLLYPLGFLSAQFVDVLAALILLAIALSGRWTSRSVVAGTVAPSVVADFDRHFLWAIAFGPIVLSLVLQIVLGVRFRDMWGTPMWDFLGLAVVALFPPPAYDRKTLGRFGFAWSAVFVLAIAVRASVSLYSPYVTHKGLRTQFPAQELADAVSAGWSKEAGPNPLAIVIGSSWYAGLVSAYADDHPSVMIDADPRKSPWITRDRLSRSGAVIIWPMSRDDEADPWAAQFPSARPQPPLMLHYQTDAPVAPILMGWAIIPPAR